MDIQNIRDIVSQNYSDEITEQLIIQDFAEDKNAIHKIMKVLDFERRTNKELIQDMNLELSRLHRMYENPKIGGKDRDKFVNENINSFYKKWRGKIRHYFNSKIAI